MKFTATTLILLFSASAAWTASDAQTGVTFTPAPSLRAMNSAGVLGREAEGVTTTIYDSFTGAGTFTTTSGSPRTYMASPFAAAGPGTIAHFEEATVYMAATAAFNCSVGMDIRVQVWDGFDGATNPIFTTAVGAVEAFTVPGPLAFAINTFTPINITFPVARDLADLEGGWAIAYRCDDGAGLVSQDSMTSLIRATGALAVGTFPTSGAYITPQFGFYRNAAGQTTFNHANTDLRVFNGINDIALALQLRGTLTPVELTSFDVE
ncbi:MAG: hypothetical protein ABI689_16750 [Thermoanaerobaculia bacterium]